MERGTSVRPPGSGSAFGTRSLRRIAVPICTVVVFATGVSVAAGSGASAPPVSAVRTPSATRPAPATSSAPGTWTWVDRGPLLLGVSCSSTTTCVAVGNEGAVLSSTAGGATLQWSSVPWTATQTDLGDTLTGVTCSGAQCLAISRGANGTTKPVSHVYRSDDSGATWVDTGALPVAAFQTQGALVLACGSADYCVIAGTNGALWLSTDGGTSWAVVPSGPQVPYTAAACPAAETCVALSAGGVGSRIVKGAVSPVATPPTGSVTAMSCGSTTQCLAVDSKSGVFASTDTGNTWTKLARPVTGTLPVTSLSCTTASACVGLTDSSRAIATADGGQTWRIYGTGTPVDNPLNALTCVGASCVAVGGAARYQVSTDGGVIWAPANAVPKMTALTCRPPSAGEKAVVCLSGGTSDIGSTTTAGQFWSSPIEGWAALDIAGVSCLSAKVCIAIGKAAVLKTANGGTSWTLATPAGSIAAGPAAATCLTASYCVAVGTGTVYTTLDGAAKWSVATITGGPTLNGVSCPTTKLCLASAAGADGVDQDVYRGVLTTNPLNPGVVPVWKWQPVSTGVTHPLTDVSCATATECVAVGMGGAPAGTGGEIIRSTDGGLTWAATITDPDDDWATVTCPTTTFCVAGGSTRPKKTGTIAVSEDGGTTWSRTTGLGPEPGIAAVDCPTTSYCVAGGSTVFAGTLGAG